MDGGGRLRRSLSQWRGRLAEAIALSRANRAARRRALPAQPVPRGIGSSAAILFLLAAGGSGMVLGGHYDAFRARHGSLPDIAARALGFGIDQVAVTGHAELTRDEVLGLSGVLPTDSLPFLDPRQVQAKLLAVPLIAEANVRKLYPDRLQIDLVERVPFGLWQKDGSVRVISADGTPIEPLNDARFIRLPHVVGEKANLRIRDYVALLESVPEFAPKIRAGIRVGDRRWTLTLVNGVEVKLPEDNPAAALRRLSAYDREHGLVQRAILGLDLRQDDRIVVRLTEEAAQAHAEAMEQRVKRLGGRG